MSESHVSHSKAGISWISRFILLIGVVVQLARILNVESSTGEVPFHSANDRSRWCTIVALAVNGSYEIDDVLQIRDPKTNRRTWYSIDLVRHRGADGKQHFYSSKPPLLPTLYSYVYMAVRAVTGKTLMQETFFVARIMLVLVNLVPLAFLWWILAKWLGAKFDNPWALTVFSVLMVFGTLLTTFANTLNNHLPAAIAVAGSLWCLDRIALQDDTRWRWFVLCGICTSFGAANELPALGWVAAAASVLVFSSVSKTLFGYLPALLPVAAAFFYFNFAAHATLAPAYAHRSAGETLFEFQAEVIAEDAVDDVVTAFRENGIEASDQSLVRPARKPGVWELFDPKSQMRYAVQPAESGEGFVAKEWGDWYDYPGSYWTDEGKQGVDKGEPNRALYVFQCLVGHHGIFSLTPFWLVSLLGCFAVFRGRETINIFRDKRLLLMCVLVATSLVVVGFYFARGVEDRNYGGVSSGFRWTFWLIPLWLWLSVYGLQVVRSDWARRCVELLVVVSVFSATFPWQNPWTSPWPMQLWEYLGWL